MEWIDMMKPCNQEMFKGKKLKLRLMPHLTTLRVLILGGKLVAILFYIR